MRGFNVYADPWITTVGEERQLLGIRDVLRNAASIRCLDEASPLETFGMLRLLLAFIHWRHPLKDSEEWARLWESELLPAEAVADLPADEASVFELLGNGPRFYQDTSVARKKDPASINNLFAALPSGTNINHAAHTYDGEAQICMRCVAKALVCLPVFCTQGGAGKSPSLNGAPPIYFYPQGDTLLQTLLLNLPVPGVLPDWPLASDSDRPVWGNPKASAQGVGFCEGLTWQPRKVYLKDEAHLKSGCALCGADDAPTVRTVVFAAGQKTGELNERTWRDPHVALADDKDKPLRSLDPVKLPAAEAGRWRLELKAVLGPLGELSSPPALRHSAGLLLATERPPDALAVSVVRHPTSQMKLLDAVAERYVLPMSLWRDPAAGDLVRQALRKVSDFNETVRNSLGFDAVETHTRKAFLSFLVTVGRSGDNGLDAWQELQADLRAFLAPGLAAPRPSTRTWNLIEKLEDRQRITHRVDKALEQLKGGET